MRHDGSWSIVNETEKMDFTCVKVQRIQRNLRYNAKLKGKNKSLTRSYKAPKPCGILYEHSNFQGRSQMLYDATFDKNNAFNNLHDSHVGNDVVSSMKPFKGRYIQKKKINSYLLRLLYKAISIS